jgi:menaquinone-dependent protoporphyrinogen oxidase
MPESPQIGLRATADGERHSLRFAWYMNKQVLIAYGSKHGSTEETAQRIATMLREDGFAVDVAEASTVSGLQRYGGVIVGGSIYAGSWHRHARRFIRHNADALRKVPVAYFAMGPKTSEPDDLAGAREQLDHELRPLPDVGADPIGIFGGVIDPATLRFPFNHLAAVDARDWKAIGDFAAQFGARLAAPLRS